MTNVSGISFRENKTHILRWMIFSRKLCCLWVMWKSVVESDRPQMTIRCMYIACLITKVTNTICNTCCFSTATMVARTVLIVTLYVHCPSYSLSLHETLRIYDMWLGSVVTNAHSTTRADHPDGCIFSFKLLSVDLRRLERAMCQGGAMPTRVLVCKGML